MKTILALLFLFASFPAQAATYEIDSSHSYVGFSVKHMMVANVRGQFHGVKGTLNLNENDITKSSAEAIIDAETIDTREGKRDDHLRNQDFFDVEKFPQIRFKSTKVEKKGDDNLKVTGDLTIRDITKNVVLDVEGPTAEIKDPWGKTRTGVSATTGINRKDFGLTWNKLLEAGGVVVGDEVKIILEIEFVKSE